MDMISFHFSFKSEARLYVDEHSEEISRYSLFSFAVDMTHPLGRSVAVISMLRLI